MCLINNVTVTCSCTSLIVRIREIFDMTFCTALGAVCDGQDQGQGMYETGSGRSHIRLFPSASDKTCKKYKLAVVSLSNSILCVVSAGTLFHH